MTYRCYTRMIFRSRLGIGWWSSLFCTTKKNIRETLWFPYPFSFFVFLKTGPEPECAPQCFFISKGISNIFNNNIEGRSNCKRHFSLDSGLYIIFCHALLFRAWVNLYMTHMWSILIVINVILLCIQHLGQDRVIYAVMGSRLYKLYVTNVSLLLVNV